MHPRRITSWATQTWKLNGVRVASLTQHRFAGCLGRAIGHIISKCTTVPQASSRGHWLDFRIPDPPHPIMHMIMVRCRSPSPTSPTLSRARQLASTTLLHSTTDRLSVEADHGHSTSSSGSMSGCDCGLASHCGRVCFSAHVHKAEAQSAARMG